MVLWSKLGLAFATLSGTGLAYFFFLLYKARSDFYYKKVKKGLPMPKWNPIFGHLLVLNEAFKKYKIPPDIHRPDIFHDLSREFDDESDSLYYMDLWPFINPLLISSSPTYAIQACQQNDIGTDRPDDLVQFLHAIAGGNSIFTINGPEWKRARNVFSSGFNSSYILNQTEHVIQEAEAYVRVLKEYASKNKIFPLDQVTVRYAMDIAGSLTLNQRLHAQQGGNNAFVSAFRNTLDWHYLGELRSPLVRWSPLIRLISWYNGRILKQYISEVLDKRYAEFKAGMATTTANRAAVDLALSDYIKKHSDNPPQQLDPEFKKWATTQLRLMFFVAHDSTSPTICYAFYLLFKNPIALRKLRAEHDEIFGKDVSAAPKLLREMPQLLNQLPYTTAVIKEVLRLFTPASGFRRGKASFSLHNDKGNVDYPTENTNVWVLHSSLHRNPNYWKDPLAFIPERYLVGPEDPLYPVQGAWRPFERGPRDCLGQTLSMLDLRITLVMTMRTFDFEDAYAEWDELHGIPKLRQCTFKGERAYQRGHGGAHPADGMPCRISVRE